MSGRYSKVRRTSPVLPPGHQEHDGSRYTRHEDGPDLKPEEGIAIHAGGSARMAIRPLRIANSPEPKNEGRGGGHEQSEDVRDGHYHDSVGSASRTIIPRTRGVAPVRSAPLRSAQFGWRSHA